MCRGKTIGSALRWEMGFAKLAEADSASCNNETELTYSYIKSDNKRKEGGRRKRTSSRR